MKNICSFNAQPLHVVILFIAFSILTTGQEVGQHKETPDQPAAKIIHKSMTSPAFQFRNEKIFVAQVNVDEEGNNIINDAANEPSIAYHYKYPDYMAIGWRQFDNISSNFRQAGYAYTTDSGETWTFPGVIDPGVFRSDPVLDSDAQGNFYYNSLTVINGNDYVCDVFKSTTGGATWSKGVDAQGGDKQWMVIDKISEIGKGNIYAYWNAAYSTCAPNSFTRSVDGGESFEECVHIPGQPYWGTLTVDKNGDLYLCGYSSFGFSVVKSTTAKYADSLVTFQPIIDVELNGFLPGFGGPNPAGITGQIYIGADTSDGEYSGNIYLLATVTDGDDPSDIMVAASTDGGDSWLPPVKVNDDNSDQNWQWFGTLSVAPNGRVDAVWLDTRTVKGDEFESELYYSFSYDGGQTWYPNVNLLEGESFDPHVGWPNQNKMGDYFDMVSDNEGVHLAWAATFNGEQDVYYARINTGVINGINDDEESLPTHFVLEQNYPNPFNPTTRIKYQVASIENVSLKVYDMLGREIVTLIDNKQMQPGTYEVDFNPEGLANGVYFYTLRSGGFVQTRKMVLMK